MKEGKWVIDGAQKQSTTILLIDLRGLGGRAIFRLNKSPINKELFIKIIWTCSNFKAIVFGFFLSLIIVNYQSISDGSDGDFVDHPPFLKITALFKDIGKKSNFEVEIFVIFLEQKIVL